MILTIKMVLEIMIDHLDLIKGGRYGAYTETY